MTLDHLPNIVDVKLDDVAKAIHGGEHGTAARTIRRLRAAVDACVPEQPQTPAPLGALPDIIGAAVTLQYPLIELERYLAGEPSGISDVRQAESYLSFVRYHLCRLEQLTRLSVEDRA